MTTEDKENFTYCDKIELHAMNPYTSLSSVVAVAGEHGFKSIVVPLCRVEELNKYINKANYGDKDINAIAAIDYPFGILSHDVRIYSLVSAKEQGAKSVEITAPYCNLVKEDSVKIMEDMRGLLTQANKYNIKIRYVLDQNSPFLDDDFRTKICRMLSQIKIDCISISSGFFDDKIDHGDNIIKMRSIKSKVTCNMKAYVNGTPSDMALYPKAGADVIGLDWQQAPFMVHEYEEMVNKQE